MMNIAIDGNEANVQKPVGSNIYALELLKALEKISQTDTGTSFTILLSDEPSRQLPKSRKNWSYQVIKPRKFWTQFALPLYLFKHRHNYQVFFTPGHYAPRLSPIPYVSSVMDVAYEYFPEQFKQSDLIQLKNWTAYSVAKAQKIITISQASKQDIGEVYKKPKEDIIVAYPAIPSTSLNQKLPTNSQIQKKFKINGSFITYVGTLQPRKNLVRLIEAFEILTRSLESGKVTSKKTSGTGGRRKRLKPIDHLTLVIAGKIGWLADPILKRAQDSPFSDRIIFTDYVTESEKLALLKHAEASVLVGLYEGFGIPPLESMAQGTIPVVANTTSLPEVVGESGIVVDPYDPHAIARGLERAITMSAQDRAKVRQDMRVQIKKFNWEKSAQTILKTLKSLS